MSMEMHVLSDRRLDSMADWQDAIDAKGFPLRLATDVDLATASGLMLARLEAKKTGFEIYHDDATHIQGFLGADFAQPWQHALGFRWLGRFGELEAAWMAATAYAAATGGVIFDHEEGRIFTPEEARETVGAIIRDRPAMNAILDKVKQKFSAGS